MRRHRSFLSLFALCAGLPPAVAETTPPADPPYPVTIQVLAGPAAPGASAPALATAQDGTVWLTWVEPAPEGTCVGLARYDTEQQTWSGPKKIVSSTHLANNAADTPLLAAGSDGRLAALWIVTTPDGGTQGQISRSADGGVTWSSPVALTTESNHIEFPALAWLPDGRLLAAWLDGRARADGKPTQLFTRIIGRDAPDTLVDDSVCDCCSTALTVFPNGSALLAYRGRTADEIRDILIATWDRDRWSQGRGLSDDEWRISGCPVNGPRLASAGGQASAVWFTAADHDPRILASTSPDAGQRFTMPQRLDGGDAIGRVDTLMLRDGSVLAIWLEDGDHRGLYLRRISPAGELYAPVRLAVTGGGRDGGYPRMALVKDYDRTPAQILVAYTQTGVPAGVRTLLVTLPDLSTLAKRNPCLPCDEDDADATRGYPMKGRIIQVLPEQGLVMVKHQEIPGVMRAMTMAFKVDSRLLPLLTAGRELLGRIEQRERDWWLFNIRLLGAPPPANPTP